MRKTEIEKILKEAEKRETQALIDCVEQTIDASRIEWLKKKTGSLKVHLLSKKKNESIYELDMYNGGCGWHVDVYKKDIATENIYDFREAELFAGNYFSTTIWHVNDLVKQIKSGKPVPGEWKLKYETENQNQNTDQNHPGEVP